MFGTKGIEQILMILLAAVWVAGAIGCDGSDTADDDDATPADDDDTAMDDDDDDDDDGDDDVEQVEPAWYGHYFTLDLNDGAGTVEITIRAYDEDQNEICEQVQRFDVAVETAPAQGDDFWQFIDRTVSWTGPAEMLDDDCWWEPGDLFGEEWDTAMEWLFNPLAFVSCESIGDNPNLAEMAIGPDPFDFVEGDTLSFGEICTEVGPAAAGSWGTGDIEGIWLIPMPNGWLDTQGDFEYYTPVSTTNVDTWGFFGVLMNDEGNDQADLMNGVFFTASFLVISYGS